MKKSTAHIIHEYGPFPDSSSVHGVSYDGRHIWFANGDKLVALDPANGKTLRSIDVPANAGTAFDGRHLYQIASDHIQKIDPESGRVLGTIPLPETVGASGLAWGEGMLWAGGYQDRKIYQIDPDSGAVLRVIESNRFVTGISWAGDELWHGTWEDGASELRRIDPDTGEVLETINMPAETGVSGLESNGGNLLFCGGGDSGKIRVVRRA